MLNASLLNLVGAKARQFGNLPFRPFHSLKLGGGGRLMKWHLLILSVVLLATFALIESAPSAQAQSTPGAPTLVAQDTNDGEVSLSWTLSDTTGVTGWDYQYKRTSAANWPSVWSISTDPALRTADISNLNVGDSYDFRVRARAGSVAGEWSIVRTIAGKPGIPENFMATPSTTEVAITLNWDAPASTGGRALNLYNIEWREDANGNWVDNPATGDTDVLAADTSVTLTAATNGLLESTTYNFRIRASNVHRQSSWTPGDGSVAAATVASLGATISATDPDPLTERTLDGAELTVDLAGTTYASSLSPGQFSLSPQTTGLSVASVQRVSNTRAMLTLAFTGNINSDLDLSVEVATAATTHSAVLTAGPVTVTRAPRPAQVTGLTLTAGPGSLEVSWNAVADADSYTIWYRVTSQTATLRSREVTGGSTARATLDGLLGETEYTVWIHAVSDFAGPGANSTMEVATTLEVTDPGVTMIALDPIPVSEGGSASYLLHLRTEPLGNVVIRVRATGNSDVTVDTDAQTPGNQDTLTFTPENYNTQQTVTVSAAQDDDAADDTATITHIIVTAQTSNEYDAVAIDSLSVLVTDPDTPSVTVTETALTIDEGRSLTYVVRLGTLPTGNVRVSVSSDHDAITVSPTAFTLTRSNWSRGQTITVRSRDDDRALPVSATLTHAIDADATSADEYDDESIASVAVRVTDDEAPVDYDRDIDQLIEITNREQLNAVRYDLDGNGVADNAADEAAYRRAFPRMMANMCDTVFSDTAVEGPPGPCIGYEVRADITLSGSWTPIGGNVPADSDNPHNPGANVFTAVFTGGLHPISGLRVSRSNSTMVGLFGAIGSGSVIRNVVLTDVNVRGRELVGALVGYVQPGGTVTRSRSTGQVTGNAVVGGLVGWNRGTIQRSYSEASVTGFNLSDSQGPLWSTQLGGLVGGNYGTVVNTYATGAVRGAGHVAGLAGSVWNNGVVRNSYATGAVSSDQDWPQVGGLVGWIYGHGSVAGSYFDAWTSGLDQSQGASQVDPAGIIVSNRESPPHFPLHAIASPGQITSKLQGTSGYRDIYCGWDNEDVNCDGGLDPVSEDIDHDGNLDVDEDVDGDGRLDVNEDTLLRNGRLDSGEDKDFDGNLDVDEDVDGDGRLDTVNEDRDGDGKLDRVAEDIDNNGRLDSYNFWRFGAATEYPCLVKVTPGCVAAGVTVTAADPVAVAEGGGSGSYSVVLDFRPTANVVITMSSNNGDVTTQPGSLIFTRNNWRTAQTVIVRAAEDDDEADERAVISHRVSGAAEYVGIAVASVKVSVADNDRVSTLSVNSPSAAEDHVDFQPASMNFIFTLSPASSQTVTVPGTVGLPSQTATVVSDYQRQNPFGTGADDFTLTFAPGEITKTLTVWVLVDFDDEPEETVLVAVGPLTNAVFGSGFGPHSDPGKRVATGTIAAEVSENRRASVTVTAADPVAVNEGGNASYTVVLDGEPTGNVVIAMSSDNGDVTAQPASLTFTRNNWDTAQTVTVNAAHDGDAADDKATVSHAVSGSDEYAGIVVASVSVAVTDDETAGVTVSESSLSLEEGNTATYTVVLDTQPIADVDIYPFAYGGVTAQPGILTFTADNWQTPQTVTVSAAQDENTENEQVVINHGISAAAESAYADVVLPSVAVSVTDDDTAEPENNAPVADAGSAQTVNAGDAVSLDGSGSSDPDGDALTYAWTQTSGPSVTLSGGNSASPGFTAPSGDGTLVFSLTVNDGTAGSAADTVVVTVVMPDPQREALEAFYNATGGGSWSNKGNWLSDKPLGQWHGVTVNGQGQVTHLALRDNGLSGSLPAALGNLEALQVLSLDRNSISGSLPTQLGNLSNLTRLALNRNSLTGSIPSQLGNLPNLSIIGLARNSLSGTLPASLGNLSGLTKLSLHDNTALSGALPDGFVNMDGMQRLAIARTGLCAPDTEAFDAWLETVPDKPDGVQTCE